MKPNYLSILGKAILKWVLIGFVISLCVELYVQFSTGFKSSSSETVYAFAVRAVGFAFLGVIVGFFSTINAFTEHRDSIKNTVVLDGIVKEVKLIREGHNIVEAEFSVQYRYKEDQYTMMFKRSVASGNDNAIPKAGEVLRIYADKRQPQIAYLS